MGDLSNLASDREAFKAKVAATYPDKKPGAIPNNAGQLFRFVHEMKVGDIVVYPSKRERKIHLGHVDGPYRHDVSREEGYPNRRAMQWLREVPRSRFSQGALYQIGSAMSLFQVRDYAEEFRRALEGEPTAPAPAKDPTTKAISEDIETTTRDFILKELSRELKGHPFAEFVAHLLGAMGYRSRVSPEGADGGIDIIAHKDDLGVEPPILKVQVKSGEGSVGDPIVLALYGKVSAGEFGLLVTVGAFTNQAKNFARSKANLRLIDGDDLVDLIL